MTSAKLGALVMTALLVMYLVMVGDRSLALISSDEPVAVLFGSLMLALPIVAAWGIVMELRFGLKIEKLGKVLEKEDAWPRFDFELRPSGRPTKESAVRVFDEYMERTQRDSQNWREWFALGLCYDAASDRARARKAMREAIRLFDKAQTL